MCAECKRLPAFAFDGADRRGDASTVLDCAKIAVVRWIFAKSGNNSVVECDLAKVEVAGSNPVSRSNLRPGFNAEVVPPNRAARRRTCRFGELRLASPLLHLFDDGSDLLFRVLLLPRIDAAGISLHTVPTGAVAKW